MDKVWAEDNTDAYFPRPMAYSSTSGPLSKVNDRYLQNIRYMRLKNLTVGYTFPQQWTRKFYVSKLRLYFTAQNLFVVTGYSGYDPEVSMRASNPMTPSLDWGAYPKSKVYTFGIDLTF